MTMICPKCHDVMRQYERNGVTVDQCQECRGIFLDRGELEYLVAAEARFADGGPPAANRASAATKYSSSPRSRKIPRHSWHWSTVTPLRSYWRITSWHFGQIMVMPDQRPGRPGGSGPHIVPQVGSGRKHA